MTEHLELVVPGQPVPKARPRIGVNGHAYTPKATVQAENDITVLARKAMHHARKQPAAGPVSVTAVFYVANRRRRDVDNLLKTVLDGLNGEAWGDDSQVVHVSAWIVVDRSRPRTEVTVRLLPGVPFAVGEPVKPPRKKRPTKPPHPGPAGTRAGRLDQEARMTIAPERPAPTLDPDWLTRVACKPKMTDAQIAQACPSCPVRAECLDDAIRTGDTETYRVGMTGRDRTDWLKKQGIDLRPTPTVQVRPAMQGKRMDIDMNDVARLRAAGQSWREIGHRYERNGESIRIAWQRSGRPGTGRVPVKRRDFSVEIAPAVLKTYLDSGATIRRISIALNVDASTVQRHIARAREAGLL